MRQLTIWFSTAGVLGATALFATTAVRATPATSATTPAKTAAAGKQVPVAATPPAAAPAAPAFAGSKIPWDDMTKVQRTKYMKTVVTPRMKTIFQAFDPVEFKNFNCATCHGKDAEKRKFQMPSGHVHHLPSTPEAFQATMAKEPTWPKWVEFMGKKVQPPMAEMLGQHLFDPKNPKAGGFGCMACHVIDKS